MGRKRDFSEIKAPTSTPFLKWNASFTSNRRKSFVKAQMIVDSEVLRLDAKLVPLRTGFLKRSGDLGTVIGSGEVSYTAPYARHQYYETAETRIYDPRRGAKWFERMKVANKEAILRAVRASM